MYIIKAKREDLEKILELQKLAFLSEAKVLNNNSIQPLTQTLEGLEQEFEEGVILKAVDENNSIIGSVRGYLCGNTLHIGKLVVHPDYQNQGLGAKLLTSIEDCYPDYNYELFTRSNNSKNVSLYEKHGYKEFKREYVMKELEMVYMRKQNRVND